MKSLSFAFLLSVSAIGACTPYDPDLGPAPFLCGMTEPRCPDGYTCMANTAGSGGGPEYCLAPNGGVPIDGNHSNCADDSQLEPNDTTTTAFQTPVATQKNTLTFAGLAICPSGDKDTYAITITTMGQNLEVLIEYEDGGATLQGSTLNSGGISIANASPVSGMPGQLRAYTPNMPTGVFYAQVYGPASGALTTNNYKLTVNVTGP